MNHRKRPIRRAPLLQLECLDGRDLPSVTFDPIGSFVTPAGSFSLPAGKDLFVPLTAVDSNNNPISYTALSSNSQVTATVIAAGQSLKLNVSGKDKDGNVFTGDLVIRLFGDIAPNAVARIVSLANSGFYNGKNFHRVVEDFMAQGGSVNGDGTGASGQGTFADEFSSKVAFVSPGLIAMANSGDDTNDSQFFIVDPDVNLARQPQHLNFNHTIFGQLVSGFDVFDKIMGTPVGPQSGTGSEVSKPATGVVINTATIITDTQDGVLRLSAPDGFRGNATITVTATASDGTAQRPFSVTGVADTVNDRPFLGTLGNLTATAGSAMTFDIPATDLEKDPLTFVVRDPNNFAATPANVTVTIDQVLHRATVTPNAGFSGTVDLLVGVRDATNRGAATLNDASNFDTQKITLTVTRGIDLDSASDTGLYADDNFTSDSTPSFTINAAAGQTVTVSVNGAGSFAATETGTNTGVYKVTLPEGKLQTGANVIAATVSGNPAPVPLTITFAPAATNVFVVPGAPGSAQRMTFELASAQAAYHSEVGFFVVDDVAGHIGTLAPGDAGYAKAALGRAQIIAANNKPAGTKITAALQGGQALGFYIVPNATSAQALAAINNNSADSRPVFFSFTAGNVDGVNHLKANGDATAGWAVYGFEDLFGGGDLDYNDRIISVRPEATATNPTPVGAVPVPAGPGRDVSVTFELKQAVKSLLNPSRPAPATTAAGETGYFAVDGPDGHIGSLKPGDAGYAKAALERKHLLFALGDALTSRTVSVSGGSLLGFYLVKGDSADHVLSANPTNSATGGPVAFFSFDVANPDHGTAHFSTFSPESVSGGAATATDQLTVHAMGKLNGGLSDFDDLTMTVRFAALT